MWRPSSWKDVTVAIGALSESPDLDFKRQLSSNNDISKDIAAMTHLVARALAGCDVIDIAAGTGGTAARGGDSG